jgi:hypothetical protein
MFTKLEYQQKLDEALLMKEFGTEFINAVVDGAHQRISIELYILKLEQLISEMVDSPVYH